MNNEQKYLLNMLKQFNQFCEEYQICYYLGGGAALGAVRHRGFIPWDDDIDLYITRKELQKLKQNKEALDRIGLVYLDHFEYPEYGNSVVRIVENTSTMFNPVRMNDETPKGSMIEPFYSRSFAGRGRGTNGMEKEADYLSGAFGLFLQSVTNESDGIHQRRIFRTLFGKGSEGWSE